MPKPLCSVRPRPGVRCIIPSAAIMRENACAGKDGVGTGLKWAVGIVDQRFNRECENPTMTALMLFIGEYGKFRGDSWFRFTSAATFLEASVN